MTWLDYGRAWIREWAKLTVRSLEEIVQHSLVRDAEDRLSRR